MIREVWGLNKVLMHVRKTGSMLGRCYLKISALLVLFSADTHFVLPIIIFLIFISVHQWALSKWALFSALSLSLQILLAHSRWLRPTYRMNTKFKMLRKYRRSQRKTVKLDAVCVCTCTHMPAHSKTGLEIGGYHLTRGSGVGGMCLLGVLGRAGGWE